LSYKPVIQLLEIDKIKKHHIDVMLSFGDPEGIRTPGLLIRSQTLYPA